MIRKSLNYIPMMRSFIAPFLLSLSLSGCASTKEKLPNEENLNIAKIVLEAFKANEFAKIHLHFNQEMKSQLDIKGLEKMWNGILMQVGNFNKGENITAEQLAKLEVVWADLVFDKTTIYLKLVFDQEHSIAGMFLLPKKR